MTASSIAEDRIFSGAPEFQNLLTTTKRIRRELTTLGRQPSATHAVNRVIKRIDDLEQSLKIHFDELYFMEREIIAVASTRLTRKQLVMLRWMAGNYTEEMVYTNLIERISEVLGMPKSTVRWNMRGLRDAGFISAGDKDTKGVPVRLTERGYYMLEYAGFGAD